MELYRQMAYNKDNFAFSPYGVASVSALVGAGAKGETVTAFKNILGLSTDNPDEIARIFGGLKQRLGGAVKVSDSIWLFRGVKPRSEFCRKVAAAFHAEARSTTGGAAAMREINAYIERNTSGKIPQLLRCPPSPDTRMMAVNTLLPPPVWAAVDGMCQSALQAAVRLYMAAMEQGAIIQVMVVLAFSRL